MKKLARVRIPQMLLTVAWQSSFVNTLPRHPRWSGRSASLTGRPWNSPAQLPPAPQPGAAQPKTDVVYVIGKSKAETDWPAFQPGSSNGKAGFRRHPYAIQFDLPSRAARIVHAKGGAAGGKPTRVAPEVAINGHRAVFYQHPELDYSGGDVSQRLPAQLLRGHHFGGTAHRIPAQGSQRIGLDGERRSLRARRFHRLRAYLRRLELDQDAEAKSSPPELRLQAVPTIFYTQKDSRLAELVDVYVRHNSPLAGRAGGLTLGKRNTPPSSIPAGTLASRWPSLPFPNSPPARRVT